MPLTSLARVAVGGLLVLAAVGCSGSTFSAGGGTAAGGAGEGGTLGGGQSAGGHAGSVAHGGAGSSSVGGTGAAGSAGDVAAGASSGGEAGSVSSAGSGGTLGDAGSGGAAGEAGCAVVAWFPDGDGDAYGRTTGQVLACEAPSPGKWVALGGDCNDDSTSVSPAQKDFRSTGYAVSGGVSFDYDCSGKEQPDPTQLGAAPACASMSLNCTGSGFAGTGRTGAGVNPLCGSRTLVTCAKNGLNCVGNASQVQEGVRCR